MLARGDSEYLVEYLATLLLYGDAVEDVAAIDVHVVDHPPIGVVIGGELDRRRRLAPVGGAATRGEGKDVGAPGDLTGRRNRIVAGRVHKDEAFGGHRLGVVIDAIEDGAAA